LDKETDDGFIIKKFILPVGNSFWRKGRRDDATENLIMICNSKSKEEI